MAIQDFMYNFFDVTIAYDIADWHRSNYSMYGDDEPYNQQQVFYNYDEEYNTYKFSISTEVDQVIYISLFTYSSLQYISTCYETFYNSEVFIFSEQLDEIWQANPGAATLTGVELKKSDSPIEVEVYTLFSEDDLLPHDWQIVVLSEKEKVQIDL